MIAFDLIVMTFVQYFSVLELLRIYLTLSQSIMYLKKDLFSNIVFVMFLAKVVSKLLKLMDENILKP